MASGCKVFVGGLSWETTDQKLRQYFENYGAVHEAFVSYDRNTGRPRGFGFVVFESQDVADKVVATKHTIDRREVEAKRAVPKEETKQEEPSEAPAQQKTRKVFVGGLAPSADEKALKEYFQQYGEVEDAVVMYDHENKRPRGFGFISFAAEEAVEALFGAGAIHAINDKPIEIKPAVPRDQLPPARRGQNFYGPGRMYGGRGPPPYPYHNGPMYGHHDWGWGRGGGRPPGGPGYRPPAYGPRPGGPHMPPGGYGPGIPPYGPQPGGPPPGNMQQLQQLQQAAAAAGNMQQLQQLQQAAAAAGLDKPGSGGGPPFNSAALGNLYNMQSLAAALPATTGMMSQPPSNQMYAAGGASGVNNLQQQLNGIDGLGGMSPDLVKQLSNALALSNAAAAAAATPGANPGYTSPESNGFAGGADSGGYAAAQQAAHDAMNLQQAQAALQQNSDYSRFTGAPGPGWSS